jgi:hypothetical protein
MSSYIETITAFTHLLENKQALFSTQDWADLDKRMMPFADDTVGLSNEVSAWCESLPEIDDALSETLEVLFPEIAIVKGAGGTGYPEMTAEEERKRREQLINLIRRNAPASSPASKPKPDASQSSR